MLLVGCRAPGAELVPAAPEAVVEIGALLDELYAAFCFDAGAEPDWQTQRRLYLPGAAFVAPLRVERVPVGQGTEEFLADFRSFATAERYASTGFHERIVDTRITAVGSLAHAFVLFEGFVPGSGAVQSRGLDSLHLIHDGAAWRLVSFTTEYESTSVSLPARLSAPE